MDEIIATELGRMRLTILKQMQAIETLKSAIDARDREIATLRDIQPELPLAAANGVNGHGTAH